MRLIKVLLAVMAIAPVAKAQSYTLEKYVIASGGGHSVSSGYQMDATIGQAIIGHSSSMSFAIDGGFWPSASAPAGPIDFAYLAGDANMANETVDIGNPLTGPWRVGGDVTFLVNYFNIESGNQPCLMFNPNNTDTYPGGPQDGHYFASADATGEGFVTGGDVSRLVQYFGGQAEIHWYGWDKPDPENYYPPQWLNNRGSGLDQPVPPLEDLPDGWPNCQTPSVMAKIGGKINVK